MSRAPLEPAPDGARPWLLVSAAFLKTGGQDRANFALASFLARQGERVHIVAHDVANEVGTDPNVTSHRVPRPLDSDLLGEPLLQRQGVRWARRLTNHPHVVVNGGNCAWPDVNWVHYVHAAYDRADEGGAARRARMRLSHRYWLKGERRALLGARVVIANSQRTRLDLIDRVGVSADRIRVVYYGIDASLFQPPADGERGRTRADVGWPVNRPVFLFIGALGDRRKGFDTLFRAWEIVSKDGRSSPLLAVIGRGALLPEWRRRVADAGLDHAVTFLGFRDDVPRLIRAADALVAPTRYEAYGLGVHEALCCGLPAIVSADAGVAERYPSDLHGLLLPDPENADDLASRIEACLREPGAVAAAVGAFAAALRTRSWDDMARDIVSAARE